ncbi:MAG: hypothetical protein LBU77_02970 [Clostridiales bacterium]|jgi:hypothetical protein|nr:hypothetical protein [Clostridiales bacterium]
MNKLKLKEFNEQHIVYLYQPEGRGEFGEVVYEFAERTARITKRASENSTWHDNKAMVKVEECVNKKNLPMELTQAWY